MMIGSTTDPISMVWKTPRLRQLRLDRPHRPRDKAARAEDWESHTVCEFAPYDRRSRFWVVSQFEFSDVERQRAAALMQLFMHCV
jgi:hypothetical protein